MLSAINLAIVFELLWHFAALSVISISGALALAPEMHRLLVDERQWMSHTQFNDAIALAQAAPGPNILFVGLLGWQAAGIAGGVAAMIGIMVPSSVITYATWRWKRNREDSRMVKALRLGLSPIAVGLTIASGCLLLTTALIPEASGRFDWGLGAIAALTVVFSVFTKHNLLWMIALGAAAGVALSFL